MDDCWTREGGNFSVNNQNCQDRKDPQDPLQGEKVRIDLVCPRKGPNDGGTDVHIWGVFNSRNISVQIGPYPCDVVAM